MAGRGMWGRQPSELECRRVAAASPSEWGAIRKEQERKRKRQEMLRMFPCYLARRFLELGWTLMPNPWRKRMLDRRRELKQREIQEREQALLSQAKGRLEPFHVYWWEGSEQKHAKITGHSPYQVKQIVWEQVTAGAVGFLRWGRSVQIVAVQMQSVRIGRIDQPY